MLLLRLRFDRKIDKQHQMSVGMGDPRNPIGKREGRGFTRAHHTLAIGERRARNLRRGCLAGRRANHTSRTFVHASRPPAHTKPMIESENKRKISLLTCFTYRKRLYKHTIERERENLSTWIMTDDVTRLHVVITSATL